MGRVVIALADPSQNASLLTSSTANSSHADCCRFCGQPVSRRLRSASQAGGRHLLQLPLFPWRELIVLTQVGLQSLARGKLGTLFQQALSFLQLSAEWPQEKLVGLAGEGWGLPLLQQKKGLLSTVRKLQCPEPAHRLVITFFSFCFLDPSR